MNPTTIDQFVEHIAASPKVQIVGRESQLHWISKTDIPRISTTNYSGIIDFRPDDLVVRVKSGTKLTDLAAEIAGSHLALPETTSLSNPQATVGGWLALGLPSPLDAIFGPVRDQVTGMTLLLGTGEIAKVGSQVVKSVAGYDIHRTMVGSSGQLAIILDATLRLRPIASFPSTLPSLAEALYICRIPFSLIGTSASSLTTALTAADLLHLDRQTGSVWTKHQPDHPEILWTIGPNGFRDPKPDEAITQLRRRLKGQIDPADKFSGDFSNHASHS